MVKAKASAESRIMKRYLFILKLEKKSIKLLNSGIFMGLRHCAITDVADTQYQQISGKQVSFALLGPNRKVQRLT